MTETLLLRMPEADRPAEWLVVDAFGNRMGQAQRGTLTEVTSFAAGRRLRVCVPGSSITLLHADIPTHSAQKILQAIPFALEDQLAEDVDTLHFAVGTRDAHGYPVAVVTRAHMLQWTSALASAGLTPAEMLPDMLTLPLRENTLVLVPDQRQWLARFPDGTGLAAETTLLPLLIKRHLAALSATQACTHALIHAADENLPTEIRELFATLQLETAYRPLNGDAIALMATAGTNSPGINLLQGEFSLHGGLAEHWRRWRIPVALLVALCIAFIVQQGVSEFKLRHAAAALNAQVASVFHQALPDVTRMVNPQVQMQQRLTQLTGGGANITGLLPMLSAVGNALQSQSGVQLQGFSYHAGSLQLQFQSTSIDALNNLKAALAQNSAFQVTLDSVNSSAGQTTGRLTLNGSGG